MPASRSTRTTSTTRRVPASAASSAREWRPSRPRCHGSVSTPARPSSSSCTSTSRTAPTRPRSRSRAATKTPTTARWQPPTPCVARLVAELRTLDVYERALVIVTADHGEGLGDHGEDEHGVFLYREATRVPLLVKPPSSKTPSTVVEPAQHVDVAPTILEAAGLEVPPGLDGRVAARRRGPRAADDLPRVVLPAAGIRLERAARTGRRAVRLHPESRSRSCSTSRPIPASRRTSSTNGRRWLGATRSSCARSRPNSRCRQRSTPRPGASSRRLGTWAAAAVVTTRRCPHRARRPTCWRS